MIGDRWLCGRSSVIGLAVVDAQGNRLWSSLVVLMRLLAGQLLIQLLAFLLAVTTPVGTGQGVHQAELLHPIFAHAHLINGRIVSDEQLAAAVAAAASQTRQAPPGAAVGAGTGADAGASGPALGPTLPLAILPFVERREWRLPVLEDSAPVEFRDSPLEPPPDLLA